MNGKRDFVLANTRLIAPPLTPEIRLWLADEAVPIWKKTEEDLGAMGLPPPFWAFAWAGGQALARYTLDHPALVKGKKVLDFASGSGLIAIAAAKGERMSLEDRLQRGEQGKFVGELRFVGETLLPGGAVGIGDAASLTGIAIKGYEDSPHFFTVVQADVSRSANYKVLRGDLIACKIEWLT